MALCPRAHANINIVPTFDSSITSNPDSQAIQDAINAAISQLEGYIANPTTVPIVFRSVTTGLGSSSTYYSNSFPYTLYRNDLNSNQTLSANDVTAINSLPAGPANPADGDVGLHISTPLLRAIGEGTEGDVGGGPDSTIDLYTGICNLSRSGTQDPNKYDLQQVALHEICEVLGAGGAGSILPSLTGPAGSLDLFRYSGPGVRSFTADAAEKAYLSIDGGTSNLGFFNQQSGGDYADWSGDLNLGPQAQDAFSTPNVHVDLNANELIALDVVGYNLTPAGVALVSKPSNALMIAGGLRAPGIVEFGRLNIELTGPSSGVVDLLDAVRHARKYAGLDPQVKAVPVGLAKPQSTASPTAAEIQALRSRTSAEKTVITHRLLPARTSLSTPRN